MPPGGWRMPSRSSERREADALLGLVDGLDVKPEERHAAGGQRGRQVERRLAAELDERAERRIVRAGLGAHHGQHALGVERLEVQPRRGVEVGRDGLRVGVDHDRLPAHVAQRGGGPDRAVVELDALPDAHRPRADDERRRPGARAVPPAASRRPRRWRRSRASRPRTRRRRCRPWRSPARDPWPAAARRSSDSREAGQDGDVAIAEGGPLGGDEQGVGQRPPGADDRASLPERALELDQALHLGQEPGRDAGDLLELAAGTPRRRSARSRQRRESDGATKRCRTSGRAARMALAASAQTRPSSPTKTSPRSSSREAPRLRSPNRDSGPAR